MDAGPGPIPACGLAPFVEVDPTLILFLPIGYRDVSGPVAGVSASNFHEARHNDEKHNDTERQDHHGFGIRNG